MDVLAAGLGVIAAFSVLPVHDDRHTERIVVPLAVFFAVAVKRKIVPTLPPNPDSSFQSRFVFMLTSFLGAGLLGMVLVERLFVVGIFLNASQSTYATLVGTALMLVATVIDWRYLKIRER